MFPPLHEQFFGQGNTFCWQRESRLTQNWPFLAFAILNSKICFCSLGQISDNLIKRHAPNSRAIEGDKASCAYILWWISATTDHTWKAVAPIKRWPHPMVTSWARWTGHWSLTAEKKTHKKPSCHKRPAATTSQRTSSRGSFRAEKRSCFQVWHQELQHREMKQNKIKLSL